MISKKARTLIPDTAKDLNLNQEIVDTVLSFFWKEVRNTLTNVDHHRLLILNLGTFEAVPKKIAEKVEEYSKYMTELRPSTYGSAQKYEHKKKKLEKMVNVKKQLDKEYQDKQNQRKLRHG